MGRSIRLPRGSRGSLWNLNPWNPWGKAHRPSQGFPCVPMEFQSEFATGFHWCRRRMRTHVNPWEPEPVGRIDEIRWESVGTDMNQHESTPCHGFLWVTTNSYWFPPVTMRSYGFPMLYAVGECKTLLHRQPYPWIAVASHVTFCGALFRQKARVESGVEHDILKSALTSVGREVGGERE